MKHQSLFTKGRLVWWSAAFVALAAGLVLAIAYSPRRAELALAPDRGQAAGESQPDAPEAEVGMGWSLAEEAEPAVREAVAMALRGKRKKSPDFAVLFVSGLDPEASYRVARKLLGQSAKIYGATNSTDELVAAREAMRRGQELTDPPGRRKSVSLMTVSSTEIDFGVGSADFAGHPSPAQAAQAAVRQAILSAGKSATEPPNVILLSPDLGKEDEVLEGIEGVVGKRVPILGGTTAGKKPSAIGNSGVHSRGISLAVLYTDLPFGWTFEAGFDVTAPESGIVTQVKDFEVVAIDGRPAWEVYDEWLDGRLTEASVVPDGAYTAVKRVMGLNPFYRQYRAPSGQVHFLFSHPYPVDGSLRRKAFAATTRLRVGERIHLSHGNWETLLNRMGNLPRAAKVRGGFDVDSKPILGIGFVCDGAMSVIPAEERRKVPFLMNYAINGAPFVLAFTRGEQGPLPEIGNKHGNLLTSFLVIGQRSHQREHGAAKSD